MIATHAPLPPKGEPPAHGANRLLTTAYCLLILLLLMTIFSQTLFALVRGHFVFLSFFTAWHNVFG
jgi:hypothetical protein